MPAEKTDIEQFLSLSKKFPVLDVRSPGEYKHAHLPEAHSLPLFTDEERKMVGTAYKQQSREAAIKIGLDYFGPKMKAMVEAAEAICKSFSENRKDETSETNNTNEKTILVYCWRGGMRSGAVSWLLDLYGFKVYTLAGGYKKFRNRVLDIFKKPFSLKILGGYTGSGKTELLISMQQAGEAVIDLEGIARHKGSAFGSIGMPEQPTQEMFENLLALQLNTIPDEKANSIWLEDESQRIGHVNIPKDFWNTMRQSPVYFIEIPFEERLKHIVQEYGQLDSEKLIDAIGRIKEKLGGLQAKQSIEFLNEKNYEESFRILLKYYDKFYSRSLHNREGLKSLLHCIPCKSITTENTRVLLHHSTLSPSSV